VGRKELNKIQDLIDTKSKILLPLSFIIPGFPDEAFCMVAGMTKMKYWYFITINFLCHIIEIGIICFFGSSLINWSELKLIEWIMIGNLIVIDIYLLFQLEKFINKKSKNTQKNDKF
ncbi:VTT domain-containing protein, partial [bacterium]|nr:VTT domain-containing protein [bacterium]